MSGREWQPGDVAVLTHEGGTGKTGVAVRVASGWICTVYGDACIHRDDQNVPISLRPLVVIDPEDREQVHALVHTYYRVRGLGNPTLAPDRIDNMQLALHEFIAPKPDEPRGVGAVVEDDRGLTWVRRHPAGLAWVNGYQTWAAWSDVAAVRVLSEGVLR